MVEIRPTTPDWLTESRAVDGGKGDESVFEVKWASTPDGRALGYGKPRALTEASSGPCEDVFAGRSPGSSVRSEPDIDTILPLPGSGAAAQAQMVNVVSPTSSDEVRVCGCRQHICLCVCLCQTLACTEPGGIRVHVHVASPCDCVYINYCHCYFTAMHTLHA